MVLSGVARSRVADRLRQEPHRPDALRFQFGQDQEAAAEPVEHLWSALAVEAGGSRDADRYPDCHRLPGAGRHRSLPARAEAHAAGWRRDAGQGRVARRLEAAGRTAAQTAAAGRQGCSRGRRSEVSGRNRSKVRQEAAVQQSASAAARSAEVCQPSGAGAQTWRIMKVRPRTILGLSGRSMRMRLRAVLGDSFETAETAPSEVATRLPKPAITGKPAAADRQRHERPRRSTGRRIIGLGGSCPKAFQRKSAWRSAESRAKRCWITSCRRRKTAWKSVRPGACRPKRSPRWTLWLGTIGRSRFAHSWPTSARHAL